MPCERSIRPDPCDSWPYPPANRPESVTSTTASKLPTNLHLPVRRIHSDPGKLSCWPPVGKSEYRNVCQTCQRGLARFFASSFFPPAASGQARVPIQSDTQRLPQSPKKISHRSRVFSRCDGYPGQTHAPPNSPDADGKITSQTPHLRKPCLAMFARQKARRARKLVLEGGILAAIRWLASRPAKLPAVIVFLCFELEP